MNDKNEERYARQLKREGDCASAGRKKFIDGQDKNEQTGNASNNYFGQHIKTELLASVILVLTEQSSRIVGRNASEVNKILRSCLVAEGDGTFSTWFDVEEAAFLGLQLTLDTALNPNKVDRKVVARDGGDKRLAAKKTLNELEAQVGEVIQTQMHLRMVRQTFPTWFRRASKFAEKPNKDGLKASTAYFTYNIKRQMKLFAEELREEGEHSKAELLETTNLWTYRERRVIGSLVVSAVLTACGDYLHTYLGFRNGKKATEVGLTELGKELEKQIREFVASYSHDLLPMLVEPLPITNDNLGGWIADTLHDTPSGGKISIALSDRHLEFINRQARVRFQLNPFIYELIQELVERNQSLGKFKFHQWEDIPSVPQLMGITTTEPSEIDEQLKLRKAEAKEVRRQVSRMKNLRQKRVADSLYAYQLLAKSKRLLNDDWFCLPMKFDGRGRIYSRVPFISFQSADAGRYLTRFAEKTPIDDRTLFWLKVGVANACGQDKAAWEERVSWFDRNHDELVNVGRMLTTGDYTRAYRFLSDDSVVEDPFCCAALCEEFVKVFVDKTQDYTQVFVCVDASCSGTSIFNAWRQNHHGALKTNLINTPEPADIYTEVWKEIKALAPEGTFRTRHLNRLEKTKLLRKMMKTTYIPASYSSPRGEQHKNLKTFNSKTLKPQNLHFTDEEIATLLPLWDEALDKVSSINSVVSWFQQQARAILASGRKEIIYDSVNGSRMTLHYPKSRMRKIKTIHYGSADYRETIHLERTDEVNKRKMLDAITANITHLTDAAALCEALWDFEQSFVSIHDACGVAPGKRLDELVVRLKAGFLAATSHPVWDTFRTLNGLSHDAHNAPPIIGDLNPNDILTSNYLFS